MLNCSSLTSSVITSERHVIAKNDPNQSFEFVLINASIHQNNTSMLMVRTRKKSKALPYKYIRKILALMKNKTFILNPKTVKSLGFVILHLQNSTKRNLFRHGTTEYIMKLLQLV